MLLKEQNKLLKESLSKQTSVTLEEAKAQVKWLKRKSTEKERSIDKRQIQVKKKKNDLLFSWYYNTYILQTLKIKNYGFL